MATSSTSPECLLRHAAEGTTPEHGCDTDGVSVTAAADPMQRPELVQALTTHALPLLGLDAVMRLRGVSRHWGAAAQEAVRSLHTLDLRRVAGQGALVQAMQQLGALAQGGAWPKLRTLLLYGALASRDVLSLLSQAAGSQILRINIDSRSVTNDDINILAEFSSLQSLTLQNCNKISTACWVSLLACFPHLRSIDLTGCNTVSDAAMHSLCSSSPKLESVCLRQCFRVGKGALAYMSQLSSLRRLVLDRVIAVTSPALADFAVRSWEQQGGSRSQLHTLIESFTSDLGKALPSLPPAPAAAPAAAVRSPLLPLDAAAGALGGASAPPAHHTTMQPVGLDGCAAGDAASGAGVDNGVLVFDFSGRSAGGGGPSHQQQDVIDWADASASTDDKAQPQRGDSDDFHWSEETCIRLHTGTATPSPPRHSADSGAPARNTHVQQQGLPVLALTHFDVSNCLKVASLDSVFASARCLTHVNLSGCPAVSSASVGILGVACGSSLRHVSLSGCHKVTNTGMQALVARCPQLRSLLLNKCRNAVDDATLDVIARACLHLVRLGINSCVHVSDVGLRAIGQMKRLTHLDIEFCHTVTDAGMEHVLEGCSRLEDVNMRMLSHLTSLSMHRIGNKWPHLRRVRVGGIDTPANLAGLMKPAMAALPQRQLHVSW